MKRTIIEGEYIGIITALNAYKSDGVIGVSVTVAVWTGKMVESYRKYYNSIFRNGRAEFQRFIRDFELVTEDDGTDQVDLSLALGCYCVAEFDRECGLVALSPVYNDDSIDLSQEGRYLDKLRISETVDNLPDIVKDYTCLPYNEEGYEARFGYFGFVVDYKVYRDRQNPDDETVRLIVAVVNGGYVREFDYYFNRIHSTNQYEFDVFCQLYDLVEADGEVNLERIVGVPFEVRLYETRAGKQYVFTLDPYYTSQIKQINWFMASYIKYRKAPHPGYTFEEVDQ